MTVPYTITPVVFSTWLAAQPLPVLRLDQVLRTLPDIRTLPGWKGKKKELAKIFHRTTGVEASFYTLEGALWLLMVAGIYDAWTDVDGYLRIRLVHRSAPTSAPVTPSHRNGDSQSVNNLGRTGGESGEDRGNSSTPGDSQSPERRLPVTGTVTPSHRQLPSEERRETTATAEMGAGAPPGAAASSSPRARARAAGPPPKRNGHGDAEGPSADDSPEQIRLVLEEAGLKESEGDRC